MEEQFGHENPLQLMSLALGGNADASHTCQDNSNQLHMITEGRNQMLPLLSPLPQWIDCQQRSESYVKYLAESGASEIQRDMSYSNLGVASCFKPTDSSSGIKVQKIEMNNEERWNVPAELQYMRPHNGGGPMNNFSSAEYPIHVEKQELNGPHTRVASAASGFTAKPHNRSTKRKDNAADISRRSRIAEGLDALQELLPHPNEGSKIALLDDIVDYTKYLQLQIKDLSQSRLGGESTFDPFIFLEGYGHCILQQEMLNEPLEEVMGKLLEVNPSAAKQLLESRGLVIMPTALANGLHQAM